MKRFIRILCLSAAIGWTANPVFCLESIELPELLNPSGLFVSHGKIYITEDSHISIYSLQDFKLIRQFGSQGQGPGEFRSPPELKVYSDYILLNCAEKIMFYSVEGKYLKERRSPGHHSIILPVGENYVARESQISPTQPQGIQRIGIYDKDLKFQRELHSGTNPEFSILAPGKDGKSDFELIHHFMRYETYKGRVYLADSTRGFHISVYNSKGDHLYDISKDFKKIKVTNDFKKRALEKVEQTPWMKDFKNRFNFVFKEYFPQIKHFSISDDLIYVSTYIEESERQQIIVLDLKGEIVKTVMMPGHGVNSSNNRPLYFITGHKYYYLIENQESENWELEIADI